ncbi:hypothetical protein ACFB49_10840 [Sphingomonas sp. DBB INV C78]|uniref:murein L,D-transpeptidase catalytic domain family protein n=1 Tax=Sphingomonas sp. DBB INV C78 TaxID=3349434 RepID=UPI0036D3EA67
MDLDRRRFLFASSALLAGAVDTACESASMLAQTAMPATPPVVKLPAGLAPDLLAQARAAMDRHSEIRNRNRLALVDFNAASSAPRFHLVDLISGKTDSYLVAHGSGSDPDHSGWLERFSNQPGSNASSSGAFVTSSYYVGKHGPSQRLIGLDPTNNNALSRAIVVHGAWYAEPGIATARGKLGRSQGCFAVGDSVKTEVMAKLGENTLIYASKLS